MKLRQFFLAIPLFIQDHIVQGRLVGWVKSNHAMGTQTPFFHYLIKPLKPEPFIAALEYALQFAAQERSEENQLLSRVPKQPSKEPL